MVHVPVLIVGGGPVGLTASFLLSRLGVPSLLVERHPGTPIHPKARGINARTMEIFRQQGVEAEVRGAGLPTERTGLIVWAHSLAGEEIERRTPWRGRAEAAEISPMRACLCAQDYLEPVLRAYAERQPGATLRFNAELVSFRQSDGAVRATILDRATGRAEQVTADYMLAADGAQSAVRKALGVAMVGQSDVYDSVNVLLEADLRPWTADRPAALYFIENPEVRGTFLTINGRDRWGFLVNSLKAQGLRAADFTPELAQRLVRLAAGVPDLPVRILGIAPWIASAHVAERYAVERVFLAGDAAHEMPPTGGFGMNTGIQDVHNLCWKIALALQRRAAPDLLATYHDERQPLGRAITEQSLQNAVSMGRLQQTRRSAAARPEYLNEIGMIFGATYRSRAIVPDGSAPLALADPVTQYVPNARPGGRAPHVWLQRPDGGRISTIDLVGNEFVLFAAAKGETWLDAAAKVHAPLKAIHIGATGLADNDGRWRELYGVEATGAVLVRPDGHVAWRSAALAADPVAALGSAFRAILSGSA